MLDLFESLAKRLAAQRESRQTTERLSRAYQCRCGTAIFFLNSQCLSCKTPLGYLPGALSLVALDLGAGPDAIGVDRRDGRYKYCGNRNTPAMCNWLLDENDAASLCVACRLNRTIPNLGDADNARYWGKVEAAKRRLITQLLALGLPVKSRIAEDPEHGLMFDFLRSPPEGPAVMTGHANGLITMNVEEADDAKREKIKHDLHEPYRTLLGHFRHEVGHYYWDLLVRDSKWLGPFRQLFGDERASYAEALKRNYDVGPPADWANSHISSYATMHPWEDWAETWAHYLHVMASLGTALGFGLEASDLEADISPFTSEDLYAPEDPGASTFLSLLNSWIEMVMVLNEVARSMGQPDFYPFVMSRPVVAKLQLVQMIVVDSRN
ncbi:MAG: putative zinc-binding metallopeptidase [Proteobacteria bacterium]|nr:putative zinc-binding metallopeptidase [Pseudomonadota bacterium]